MGVDICARINSHRVDYPVLGGLYSYRHIYCSLLGSYHLVELDASELLRRDGILAVEYQSKLLNY